MKQEDYKLWTGIAVSYDEEDWARLVSVASKRLASFLCLEALPDPMPDDLQELLANWMAGVFKFQGGADTQIEEKRIRNFTIRFSSNSAVNAFAQIAKNYPDTLERYSQCGSSISVEKSKRHCCGRGYYGCF